MANLILQEALLVGSQVGERTADLNTDVQSSVKVYTTDIEAGTPDYTLAQGVKFQDESLTGDAVRRISLEGEFVQGSPTADLMHKVNLEGPETFSFTTRLHGSGHPLPAGDGDLDLPPALRLLFEGLGITKTSGDIGQSLYNGGAPTYLTFSRMTGDATTLIRYIYGSCLVQSVSIVFPPNEPALATWTVMVGHLSGQIVGGVFPPFPDGSPPADTIAGYASMDTLPAAPFIGAAARIGATTRKPGELTLTITQEIEPVGNGNQTKNGTDLFPTNRNRVVELAGDYFVESTDATQEFDDMDLDLSVDDFTFTYGQVATNTLKVSIFNAVISQYEPVRKGNQYGHTISARGTAVGSVAGSEFELLST